MTNENDDPTPLEQSDASLAARPPTRRGFLRGLLGGIAGIAGLNVLGAWNAKTERKTKAGKSHRAQNAKGPIDNIFVPRAPRKNMGRREL